MIMANSSDSEEKQRLVPNSKQEKSKQIGDEEIMVEIHMSFPYKIRARPSQTKIKQHVKRTFTNLDHLPHDFKSDLIDGTYDERVNQDDGIGYIDGCRQHGNWWSWIWLFIVILCTTLIIIGRIIFPWDKGYWLLLFPIFIACVLYSFEWYFISSTSDYLDGVDSKENVVDYLEKLHQTQPEIEWKSQSFHYTTKKHTKVITDEITMKYTFNICRDESKSCELNEYELTKLSLFKTFKLADDETTNDYYNKFDAFCKENKKDEYQHVDVIMKLENYHSRVLVNAAIGHKAKCWTNKYYKVFSVLFCSPCYRMEFNAKSGVKSHIIQKEISILPMFADQSVDK